MYGNGINNLVILPNAVNNETPPSAFPESKIIIANFNRWNVRLPRNQGGPRSHKLVNKPGIYLSRNESSFFINDMLKQTKHGVEWRANHL